MAFGSIPVSAALLFSLNVYDINCPIQPLKQIILCQVHCQINKIINLCELHLCLNILL